MRNTSRDDLYADLGDLYADIILALTGEAREFRIELLNHRFMTTTRAAFSHAR
jgi:hypothetical protein